MILRIAFAFMLFAGAGAAQNARIPNRSPMSFVGNYVPTLIYGVGDTVAASGVTYTSLREYNVGNSPATSPNYWTVLAAPGQGSLSAAQTSLLNSAGQPGGVATLDNSSGLVPANQLPKTLAQDAAAAAAARQAAAAFSPANLSSPWICDAVPIYTVVPTASGSNVTLVSVTLKSGTDNTNTYNAMLAAANVPLPTYEVSNGGAARLTNNEGISVESSPQSGHLNTIRLPNNCQAYIASTTNNAPDGIEILGNHSSIFVPQGQTAIRSINTNANGHPGGSDVNIQDLKVVGLGTLTDTAPESPLVYVGGMDRLTLRDDTFANGLTGTLIGAAEYFEFSNSVWSYNRVGREYADGPGANYDGTNDGSGYPVAGGGPTIDASCFDCQDRNNYLNAWYHGAAGMDEIGGTTSYAAVIPYVFGDGHPDWITSITQTGTVACAANQTTNLTITDTGAGKGAEFTYTCNSAGNGGKITKYYAGRGYTASSTTVAAATSGFFTTAPTFSPVVRSMKTWGSYQGSGSPASSQILIQGKNIEVLNGNDINLVAYIGANAGQVDFSYNQFASDGSIPHLALADGTANKFKDNWGMITNADPYTGLTCPLLAGVSGAFVGHAPESDESPTPVCDMFTSTTSTQVLNPSPAGGSIVGQSVASVNAVPRIPFGGSTGAFETLFYTGTGALAPAPSGLFRPNITGLPGSAICHALYRANGAGTTLTTKQYSVEVSCNSGSENQGLAPSHWTSDGSVLGSETWHRVEEEVASPGYFTFAGRSTLELVNLTGNLAISVPQGTTGFQATWMFCQDATGGRTITAGTNGATIHGLMTVGATANTCSAQTFVYSTTKGGWYSTSPGVINQ